MGLLDEVQEISGKTPGRLKCGVSRILNSDQLSKEDRTDLINVMDRPVEEVGHWTIQTILQRRNIGISQGVIAWHRNHRCSCNPEDRS